MSTMQLCLSMWSLQEEVSAGRMDLAGFLAFCSHHHVQTVELLGFLQKETPGQTRRMLADRSMRAGAWSAANNFVQPSPAELRRQIDGLKRCVDEAAEVGAPILRVFSGDEHPAVGYQDGLKMILDAFGACEPHARSAGIVMALENHGVFAGTSGQVNGIIEAIGSPYLRATVDTANFLFVDEDPLSAVRGTARHAAWVHFKDYRPCAADEEGAWPSLAGRHYAGCALGEGCVGLKGIAAVLSAGGYQGCLSIEFEGPQPLDSTVRSIHFVQAILAGA